MTPEKLSSNTELELLIKDIAAKDDDGILKDSALILWPIAAQTKTENSGSSSIDKSHIAHSIVESGITIEYVASVFSADSHDVDRSSTWFVDDEKKQSGLYRFYELIKGMGQKEKVSLLRFSLINEENRLLSEMILESGGFISMHESIRESYYERLTQLREIAGRLDKIT